MRNGPRCQFECLGQENGSELFLGQVERQRTTPVLERQDFFNRSRRKPLDPDDTVTDGPDISLLQNAQPQAVLVEPGCLCGKE